MPLDQNILQRLQQNDPTLTSLGLKWNSIDSVGAQALAAALAKNTTLTLLDLRANEIGAVGAQALAAALAKNTTLTSLDLGTNVIGAAGAQAFAAALAKNTTLTSLDLGWNKIDATGVQALAAALEQNTTLTSLDLMWNEIDAAGAQALAAALEQNTALTSLGLKWNSIDAVGAQSLAAALAKNTTLTSLDLGANVIGAAGAQALAATLEQNKTLTSLNLMGGRIDAAGAQSLAAALAKNTTLTSLDLRANGIGAVGAQALAAALEKNTTLTSLALGYNSIGDVGAQALAAALAKNMTLTSLDLESNGIGAAGIQALAAALAKNTALTSLDLKDNWINVAGMQALAAALEQNKTLTSLDLEGRNNICAASAQAFATICAVLRRNATLAKLKSKEPSRVTHDEKTPVLNSPQIPPATTPHSSVGARFAQRAESKDAKSEEETGYVVAVTEEMGRAIPSPLDEKEEKTISAEMIKDLERRLDENNQQLQVIQSDSLQQLSPDIKQMLESQQNELQSSLEITRAELEARAQIIQIQAHPALEHFYVSFQVILTNLFISARSVQGGFAGRNETQSNTQMALQGVKEISPHIPVVGIILKVFAMLGQKLSAAQQIEAIKRLSEFMVIDIGIGLEIFIEKLARQLTLKQIDALKSIPCVPSAGLINRLRKIRQTFDLSLVDTPLRARANEQVQFIVKALLTKVLPIHPSIGDIDNFCDCALGRAPSSRSGCVVASPSSVQSSSQIVSVVAAAVPVSAPPIDHRVTDLQKQVAELQKNLAALDSVSRNKHTEIETLKRKIVSLEKQLFGDVDQKVSGHTQAQLRKCKVRNQNNLPNGTSSERSVAELIVNQRDADRIHAERYEDVQGLINELRDEVARLRCELRQQKNKSCLIM